MKALKKGFAGIQKKKPMNKSRVGTRCPRVPFLRQPETHSGCLSDFQNTDAWATSAHPTLPADGDGVAGYTKGSLKAGKTIVD